MNGRNHGVNSGGITKVVVVSVASADNSPCLVLQTESSRVFFDVPEGCQRLCIEYKFKFSKLDTICFTRLAPDVLCGLPGLMLTACDAGKSDFRIVGPKGTRAFWKSTQYFMKRSTLNLDMHECCSEAGSPNSSVNYDADKDVSVFYVDGICIRASHFNNSIIYVIETASVSGKFDVQKAIALNVPRGPLYGRLKQGHDVTLEDGTVIQSSQVVGPSERGKVIFIIGEIDIASSSSSSSSGSRLSSLLQNHPFFSLFEREHGSRKDDVECVYHMGCRQMMEMDDYQLFIASIGGTHVKHISLGRQMSKPISAFVAASTYTNKLQRILPELYPKLSHTCCHDDDQDFSTVGNITTHRAYPGFKYILSPERKRGIEEKEITASDEEINLFWREAVTSNSGAIESLHDLNTKKSEIIARFCNTEGSGNSSLHSQNLDLLSKSTSGETHDKNEPYISFLGTASAIPSKYRNVTGIHLRFSQGGGMLLDAGEATWQQLLRLHTSVQGVSDSSNRSTSDHSNDISRSKKSLETLEKEVAKGIDIVWISHPHADHHLGLTRVLSERKKLIASLNHHNNNEDKDIGKVLLIAPPAILAFLRDYSRIDPSILDSYIPLSNRLIDDYDSCTDPDEFWTTQVPCNRLTDDSRKAFEYAEKVFARLNVQFIRNVRVMHCPQSYGVAINFLDGLKIVYSGDTRPTERLVKLGKDATILIHEATFDDAKKDEAVSKRHSTVSEAMDIANRMNACRLILTHFSQRYPTMPPTASDRKGDEAGAIFAFDFLRISFKDLIWAPYTTGVLAKFFPPAEDDSTSEVDLLQTDIGRGRCKCECGKEFLLEDGRYFVSSEKKDKKRKANHLNVTNDSAPKTDAVDVSVGSADNAKIITAVEFLTMDKGCSKMTVMLCGECVTKLQK